MSQYVAQSTTSPAIEHRDQLVEYFAAAVKPRERWRIGTEYEKVAVRAADGHAAPFSGPRGIEALLKGLADRYGWEPVEEDGRVVALKGARAWITLEPGGQLELSGGLCETMHEAHAEVARHVAEIVSVADPLGLAFLGLGMQPVSRLDEIEWVPKRRYRIMAPHMQRVGTLGHRMMKQTAGVQVNLDYASEADAMQKLRTGTGLVPVLTAMFANSALCDGKPTGYLCYRGHIWTDTDAARCGLPAFVFRRDAGFADYVEYALDVPMYFIVRDGTWFDMTELTFRQFLAGGHAGHRATMEDWATHLTTLFPEVRMKGYLEVRCTDSQMPELLVAVPALVKGVFYEADCLLAAWDLVKRWSVEERLAAWDAAHRLGLHARVKGVGLAELARHLLVIATEGLRRQQRRNEHGEDESVYLERLEHLVRRGVSPAEMIVEKWTGEWDREPSRLVAGTRYCRFEDIA
jgi:glutamate--cysteine ligase